MTRIGPDGEPHPLKAVDTVNGPDEYRYYDRGHVYFSIPPLGEKVAVQYRFEYELIGAVTPAWAIAAGPGSRASDEQELFWPWQRIGHVVADWRRAWPALTTRYRFDHDVLLPEPRRARPHVSSSRLRPRVRHRVARHHADRRTSARRRHGAYRAHKVFDYLGPGDPAAGHDGAGGLAARLAGGAADRRHPRLAARGGRGPSPPRPADRSHLRRHALPDPRARGDRLLARGQAAGRRRRPGAPRRRGRDQHPRRSAGRAHLRGGGRATRRCACTCAASRPTPA